MDALNREEQKKRLHTLLQALVQIGMDRDEIMQFLCDVDTSMADTDFTVDLISRLAIDVAEEMESDEFWVAKLVMYADLRIPELPGGNVRTPIRVRVSDVVQMLAQQSPHLVVQIMGDALHAQRKESER